MSRDPVGGPVPVLEAADQGPYDKQQVDAYTRTRVILMNGIENGAWNFAHHFSRSTDDPAVKSLLAQTRMVEQQQQTTIKGRSR
jgi:hypothetical protein